MCQHVISLQKINYTKKRDPNKFNEDLFNFIEQYVVVNSTQNYVCKSCGQLLPLKQYVTNGSNSADGKFIIFNMPLDIPLEEIKEYSKLNNTIRNMDKLIERMCSITDIQYYFY